MKLMKTMKMCLKCRLLFTIPCFRESDEKKIEVEDEKGRKEENSHNPVFSFYHNIYIYILPYIYMVIYIYIYIYI